MATPTTTPLLAAIPTNSTAPGYSVLSKLLGTWNSPSDTPTGYNVMPVPAGNKEPGDYQNKNFYYFEEMTFTAPGEAPNRGQLFQQGCYGLTYEQRVYFAPNTAGIGGLPYDPTVAPASENALVHYENGLWLHTQYEAQPEGAYPSEGTLPFPPTGGTTPPPPANPLVKQVSVPHGNSILALGDITTTDALPTIDTTRPTDPPFSMDSSIPNPAVVLADFVATLQAKSGVTYTTTQFCVATGGSSGGSVTNIPFEAGNADVSGYSMTLWIIEGSDGATYLMYLQSIPMTFFITATPSPDGTGGDGTPTTFAHITANTLTKVA